MSGSSSTPSVARYGDANSGLRCKFNIAKQKWHPSEEPRKLGHFSSGIVIAQEVAARAIAPGVFGSLHGCIANHQRRLYGRAQFGDSERHRGRTRLGLSSGYT